ncbi:MAG: hypothetical protein C0403_03830 [Desulfobacterium sp.]|nr:hypothetical protein [Desulfobacterium sp.]
MEHQHTQPFISIMKNYPEQLLDLVAEGRKFIGYFCTYTPIEVIHASGFVPIRLLGGSGPVEKAYSLVPDFICPYMKRTLEKALAGKFDFLSGVIQGYTCDVACGLVNIWKEHTSGDIFATVPLPYNDTPAGRNFFKAEIDNLIKRLNNAGGTFSMSALINSIELYGNIRRHLMSLYKDGYAGRLPLSAEELHYIGLASTITPPETFLDMLRTLSSSIEDTPLTIRSEGMPVLISGSLIEDPLVSCVSIERRKEMVLNACREYKIDGVVMHRNKSCVPITLGQMDIKRTLEKELGIPSVIIDADHMDARNFSVAQFQARADAFMEMLLAKKF